MILRSHRTLLLPLLLLAVVGCSEEAPTAGRTPVEKIYYSYQSGGATRIASRSSAAPSADVQELYAGLLESSPRKGVLVWIERPSALERRLVAGNELGVATRTLRTSSDLDHAIESAVLSPDGSTALFTTADNRLYAVRVDGTLERGLSDHVYPGTLPAFSPDGSRIAYYGLDSRLHVLPANGGDEATIATNAEEDPAYPLGLAWSPAGDRIVYVGKRNDGGRDLYLGRPNGGSSTPLTDDLAFEASPVWSPDGKSIAYVVGGSGSAVLDTAAGTVRSFPAPANEVHAWPAWSPDGSRILVTQRVASSEIGGLVVIDLATSASTTIVDNVYRGFWVRD